MLYNVNPLCDAGQAGAPKAALRMNMQQGLKIMSWCYEIAGVAGGTVTRPISYPANSLIVTRNSRKVRYSTILQPTLESVSILPAKIRHCPEDACGRQDIGRALRPPLAISTIPN